MLTIKWVAHTPVSTERGVAIAEMAGAGTPTALLEHRSMTENESTADKRVVEELNFGAKTIKRVTWEAWEFAVNGPHQIEVTNAAYGFQKDDHSYVVGIEERDGLLVPAECGCKADLYREEYDCKHKVALASVGGPVVLQAAVDCPTPTVDIEGTNTQTLEEKLRADGGIVTDETTEDSPSLNESDNSECDCAELSEDFPCWSCYREGRKELPE